MRRLKNRAEAPPDFFRFTHPETGHTSVATDYYSWSEKIKEHRRANNLPNDPEIMLKAEDQLCSIIPPELWEYEKEGDMSWVNTRISVGDVVDFTKILIAQAKEGNEYVSQEEANRRARICAGCYLNVNIMGCGVCGQLLELVIDKQTDYDTSLKNCAVCHCFNRAQVHFRTKVLDSADSEWKQSHYPKEFCWKSHASPNYQA
jgi:hypothetical protein